MDGFTLGFISAEASLHSLGAHHGTPLHRHRCLKGSSRRSRSTHRQAFRVPNDPAGHRDLLTRIAHISKVLRIVLESTGGYEMPVAIVLAEKGLPVAIVNPRRVRNFSPKPSVAWPKTDSIDAAVLAHFAETVQPPIRTMPSSELQNSVNSLIEETS
ncbi:MAG: transposase [Gemmataceae bacterium]